MPDPAPAPEGRPAPAADPCAFVVFGVTGDLAARKLLPALWALHRQGSLHEKTRLIGYARSAWDTGALQERLGRAVRRHGDDWDEEAWRRFARRIDYVRGGYGDAAGMEALAARLDELGVARRLFYTATPPGTYADIAGALAAAGLAAAPPGGYARLVVEKPFGRDLVSARTLNRRIGEGWDEDQVYRIDHYLAKESAQNLAALRFANSIFEPMWSNRYIDHVQITMAEEVGIEGRGSFYEDTGVVRDVFQNHLLQLLALVAMEPPVRWKADAVRDEKVKVFGAMECDHADEAVLGQYVAGEGMRGYREEDGVDPASTRATYAAVPFGVRTWRWAGVPFYLRSGKRLGSKVTEIVLHFATPPHVPFELDAPLEADRLILRVTPNEGISLRFNAKRPGQGVRLEGVSLDFSYDGRFDRPTPDAYETLLLDAMQGDATLFMRADEVEAQWRVIDPLLARVESGRAPHPYPAGSEGPAAAAALLERVGRRWHTPERGQAPPRG